MGTRSHAFCRSRLQADADGLHDELERASDALSPEADRINIRQVLRGGANLRVHGRAAVVVRVEEARVDRVAFAGVL